MSDKPQEESIKDQIIALLQKGYKRDQLINDLGFKERTVDAAIRAYKELNNGNEEAKEGGSPVVDDGASAPSSKSKGKGVTGTPGRDGALAIRKDKESVLPEWLERDVAEIFDGQTHDQRIFLAGMSVPLMGLRLFAEGVKPIIDLLATWQEGQAQASRAAQGSGIEMAREAGEVAASGVAKFFLDTKPWLSASPDPLKAMVVDTMRPVFQQVFGQLTGTFLRGFGMPQAGSPGQPMPQNPPQGQTPLSTPGVEQIGKDEMEEVFKDG
jgi:hypothetical protein